VHPSFKINKQSFTETSLLKFSEELTASDEIYLKDIGVFITDWMNEYDYVLVNTSGSTGAPKEIKLLKKHMRNSALATGSHFGLNENTKALLCLSATYIAGKMMLVRAMVLGWDIHLMPPIANPLKNLTASYDFCAMVPLQVESSLVDLHKIKQLIIGGAPISSTLNKELQAVTTNCFGTYGMTETITHIAVKKLNNFSKGISNESDKSHYHILPNVSISKDKRGCLVIDAPKVSKELVVTNDIVKIESNSEFEWLGRYDNIINSGGVKLFPEQIEEKLSRLIKERFFVAGIPDEKLGEKLILVIESDVNMSLSKSDYQNCQLSKYEIPKDVFTLSEFIETSSGKIQRKQTLTLL